MRGGKGAPVGKSSQCRARSDGSEEKSHSIGEKGEKRRVMEGVKRGKGRVEGKVKEIKSKYDEYY